MPVRTSVVGTSTPAHRATCDARWLMAYSAGVGLTDAAYFDTTRPGGVVAHPLFPVGVEWGVLTSIASSIDYGLTPSEVLRGVHAGHEMVLHRPIHQDDEVAVTGTVAGVETTSAGARVTVRLEAVDLARDQQPIWTTWYVTLYRGTAVDGVDVAPVCRPLPTSPRSESEVVVERRVVPVDANAAHVYTECARIWNPIHTDLAVANAAGLSVTILHGTATLALGVTSTLDMVGGPAESVRRIAGSFRAMVPMPNTLAVELVSADTTATSTEARFQVRNDAGDVVVRDGLVEIGR